MMIGGCTGKMGSGSFWGSKRTSVWTLALRPTLASPVTQGASRGLETRMEGSRGETDGGEGVCRAYETMWIVL